MQLHGSIQPHGPGGGLSFANRYLGVLIEQVYKYEGIIDKFTGDGIMAIFGAPIAHENDAERAVRAAIDIQAGLRKLNSELHNAFGVEVQARLGLHYGAVIFGQVGVNLGDALSVMDYTAVGDIVNLAARLERAAEPGAIIVSRAIHDRTKALIEYHPVHPLTLKGLERPVEAFRVVGLKARPGRVRGLEGRQPPLIGRKEEMERLLGAVEALEPGGTGRILLLVGEGGIGKSRLTAEFLSQVRGRDLSILEGGSLGYRRTASYWVFQEILVALFGFRAGDSDQHHRKRIRQRLSDLGGGLLEVAPLVERLLSVRTADPEAARRIRQLQPEQLRQQTFVAVRDILTAEAKRRPLLLILEDLHWADDLSLELVKHLMDVVLQAPLLLYCIVRPVEGGVMERLSEQASDRFEAHFVPVHLWPLTASQGEALLNALLEAPDLPRELRIAITMRAEGNPFFLEETIRMLISDGIIHREGEQWQVVPGARFVELSVPDTLQGLVMARFDRLADELRTVLQVASVIGFRFSSRLLEEVMTQGSSGALEGCLPLLEAQDFVTRMDHGAEHVYAFRHVITMDTIYRSILRRERAVIHGRVAQAFERLYRDRLSEYVGDYRHPLCRAVLSKSGRCIT